MDLGILSYNLSELFGILMNAAGIILMSLICLGLIITPFILIASYLTQKKITKDM